MSPSRDGLVSSAGLIASGLKIRKGRANG